MRQFNIGGWLCLAAAVCLSACGPTGGVASPGSSPAASSAGQQAHPLTTSESVVAAVADATLPPISTVSPLASTTIDDAAIAVAYDALDTAAYAADALLAVKPKIAGTPTAKQLADALEGASTWLRIASQAQRAGQAANYRAALEQAKAALAGARSALGTLKGN